MFRNKHFERFQSGNDALIVNMKKRITIVFGMAIFVLAVLYYLSPDWIAKFGLSVERLHAGLTRHSIQVEKIDYAYLSGGTGSVSGSSPRAKLLLIHGFSGDKDNYVRFARHLTDSYEVIIPDLPGFGESTRDMTLSYDITSQVLRLKAFVQKINLESFHLAGHSMGGAIAGAYAADFPDQVISLLLLAPAGVRSAPDSKLFKMMARGENPFMVNETADFENLMDLVFYDKPFVPRPVKRFYAQQSAQDRELLGKILSDLKADSFALERRISRYPGFVLVIWGDHDQVLHPAGAQILAHGTAGVEMEILKHCGHMPILEQPRESARLYQTFLQKVQRQTRLHHKKRVHIHGHFYRLAGKVQAIVKYQGPYKPVQKLNPPGFDDHLPAKPVGHPCDGRFNGA